MTQAAPETPPFLRPFVLPVVPWQPVREGNVDWYLPSTSGPAPAVVFVHGGPVPDWLEPKPRAWPSYQAYGAWAAGAGLVGVTFDHPFSSVDAWPKAQVEIERVVEATRARPDVDPDRIVVWGFSGGGTLLGRWITRPEPWLRGVAASYPLCRPLDELPVAPVTMAAAVLSAGDLPLLLTRVGRERDEIAETVAEFVEAADEAGARLDVIDVPDGHHGFDQLADTEESRRAIRAAMDWVAARLQ